MINSFLDFYEIPFADEVPLDCAVLQLLGPDPNASDGNPDGNHSFPPGEEAGTSQKNKTTTMAATVAEGSARLQLDKAEKKRKRKEKKKREKEEFREFMNFKVFQ